MTETKAKWLSAALVALFAVIYLVAYPIEDSWRIRYEVYHRLLEAT